MRKSRLSWHKQSRLIELFVAGSTARTSAQLVAAGMNPVLGITAEYQPIVRMLLFLNESQ